MRLSLKYFLKAQLALFRVIASISTAVAVALASLVQTQALISSDST